MFTFFSQLRKVIFCCFDERLNCTCLFSSHALELRTVWKQFCVVSNEHFKHGIFCYSFSRNLASGLRTVKRIFFLHALKWRIFFRKWGFCHTTACHIQLSLRQKWQIYLFFQHVLLDGKCCHINIKKVIKNPDIFHM